MASVREQCRRLSVHDSRDAGSAAPAFQSRADPANAIVSPTAQVVAAEGVSMVATGTPPTVIVVEVVPVMPPGSVTRSRTVTVPALVYVRDGATCVESS